jgi:hypothetical protein
MKLWEVGVRLASLVLKVFLKPSVTKPILDFDIFSLEFIYSDRF